MEVTITPKKETSQVEMAITVPAPEFKPYIEKAARQLSQEHKIKGFRPGKAPVAVVAQTVGQEHLLHTTMDLALSHFFIEAMLNNDIEAINRPAVSVEELGLEVPFRFTAVVDVMPEVNLAETLKLSAEKRDATVKDEEVDKELSFLAKSRSTYTDVDRGAQDGDSVTVDFKVTINGELIEGGESKNHPLTLGEGQFVPDFEKGIIGLKKDETRNFSITFPDDFPKEDMRGKKADVEVTVHAVQERVLPEINDEFAKTLGKFESLANLKEELKKNMQSERVQKEKDRYQGELAEQLATNATFGFIPEILIEKEIDVRLQEFSQMLAYQQKTIDDYLKQQKKTAKDMRDDMREASEKHIKIGLAMQAFAKQHDITADDAEVEEQVNQQLAYYKTTKQAATDVDPVELRDRVASTIRNRKTLEKLAEVAEKK